MPEGFRDPLDRLGEAGVNLRAIYVTGLVDDVELAIVADNVTKTRAALE